MPNRGHTMNDGHVGPLQYIYIHILYMYYIFITE